MKLACFLGILAMAAVPTGALELWGVELDGLEVHGGGALILNSVADSAPDPIVNTIGVSLPVRFLTFFTFRPESLLFTQTYAYQNGRAVPSEAMFDSVQFLTWIINPAVGAELSLTPELTVGAEVSLNFFTRFPSGFLGTGGDQALDATGWFYAGGRFIFPSTEVHGLWQFSELLMLTLRGTVYYPVFNLWTGDPWYDQLMFGTTVGLRVRI